MSLAKVSVGLAVVALIVAGSSIVLLNSTVAGLSDDLIKLRAEQKEVKTSLEKLQAAESGRAGEAERIKALQAELEARIAKEKLVELARAEGSVVFYTTITPVEAAEGLIARFKAAHPFLEVKMFRGNAGPIYEKYLSESKAGVPTADVIMIDANFMFFLRKGGHLAPYRSPELANYDEAFRDKDGLVTVIRPLLNVITYNTNVVPPGEVPKSYEDLVKLAQNPKYKGMIATLDPRTAGFAGILLYWMNKKLGDKTWEWWSILKAANLKVPDFAPATEALSKGEIAILMLNTDAFVRRSIAQGRPVAPVIPNDLPILIPTPIGITQAASHKNAAKLFVDWMLSREGQAAIVQVNQVMPARADVTVPANIPNLKDVLAKQVLIVRDWDEYDSQIKGLVNKWAEVTGR